MYAKMSKKGQITIPKSIRKKLNIDKDGGVLFLVEKDEVKIKGIPAGQVEQLAGSLKKYAPSCKPPQQTTKIKSCSKKTLPYRTPPGT